MFSLSFSQASKDFYLSSSNISITISAEDTGKPALISDAFVLPLAVVPSTHEPKKIMCQEVASVKENVPQASLGQCNIVGVHSKRKFPSVRPWERRECSRTMFSHDTSTCRCCCAEIFQSKQITSLFFLVITVYLPRSILNPIK